MTIAQTQIISMDGKSFDAHDLANGNGSFTTLFSRVMGIRDGRTESEEGIREFFRFMITDFLNNQSYINTFEETTVDPQEFEEIFKTVTKLCRSALPPLTIRVGTTFSVFCYKKHPLKLKIQAAYFCSLATYVDDICLSQSPGSRFLEDLGLFQLKLSDSKVYETLYPGRGDLHEVLELLIIFLTTDQNPFISNHPVLHTLFVRSTLGFLIGCKLWVGDTGLIMQGPATSEKVLPEMKLFPDYIRTMDGISETFALFATVTIADDERLWEDFAFPMIPEFSKYTDYSNDIFSLYKELHQGEESGFLFKQSCVQGIPLLEVINQTCDKCIDISRRVAAISDRSGSAELKKLALDYLQGYMSFHIVSRRYLLKEVLGDWFKGEYLY